MGPHYRTTTTITAVALTISACAGDSAPITAPARGSSVERITTPNVFATDVAALFSRYVAIGTSVSMGVQHDGVIAANQETSWPAQLSRMAQHEMTQPYIDGTGCRSPLRAPLASGVRLSGEGAGQNPGTLSCSALRAGIALPVQNVAINAARTSDALFTTPENITDPGYTQLYARVLRPGQTQVSTMLELDPEIVSVELGANEVLNVRGGIALAGGPASRLPSGGAYPMVPVQMWAPLYNQVLDQVQSTASKVVVAGLIKDVSTFPAFRRSTELWADRATFLAAFNVSVSPDCDTSDPSLVFVPVVVPTAVATGVARRRAGLGPHVLSCKPAAANVQDYILSSQEILIVNAQLKAMNQHIAAQATARGLAHFELEALYGRPIKPPFSVLALMTSPTPYGQYISLDGLHPSADGARVIAEAAAAALDARYGLGLTAPAFIASR